MDSASGSHCTDFTNFLKKHRLAASGIPCFERTADLKSSSLSKPATAVQGEAEAGFFRKFVKNSTSNTAIPRILEEEKQASLRDTAPAVAWQSNSAQAESNQINGACEARNLKSVVGVWGVKGGIRGATSQFKPPRPPLKGLYPKQS